MARRSPSGRPRGLRTRATLSRRDIQGSRRSSWKTTPTWRPCPCSATTGLPSSRTVPRVAGSRPPMILSSVVFPHPFGPSRQTNSPASTLKETLSMIGIRKSFPTPATTSFTAIERGELLAPAQPVDVPHLEEAPVHVLHPLDDVGGDHGEGDHEGREDGGPVAEAGPDDGDHDPDEERGGVEDGEK